ncbi:MAG: hypothetical protein KF893_22175, partial [Caldilineaceae bacterium]|nr:hypothetical protein [Caldilineaceae bacterium]
IAQAYREMQGGNTDPIQTALAALFSAASYAAVQQAMSDHPLLLELPTLERLASTLEEVHAAGQQEGSQALLARLLLLFDHYNHTHVTDIDPIEQERFVALHQRLLPLADAMSADLRRSAAWAFNTLGNHYADNKRDLAQAVAAYTSGVDMDETNAMILRNRAGLFLDLEEYAAAAADIDAAAALEPDAARLSRLRCGLYAGLGDASSLLAQAIPHQAANPSDADANLYLAIGYLLSDQMTAARTAMAESARLANETERSDAMDLLGRLARRHPSFAAAWQELTEMGKGDVHG